MKWILRTALPLNPQFNLFYNGQRVESSKIDVPVLKEWVIGQDDKTAETFKDTVCKEQDGKYTLDFENLKGISGRFILYKDSLVSGKSSGLGRSHGIFLNIRGRLINLDDPLLGLEDAVYRVLLALGFETIKIGGNGKPYGKADAQRGYNASGQLLSYSLTYDAKSTAREKIAAGTAHLSGLKRHQSDYKADYALEVAIGYQGEDDPDSAISKEAIQQKVTIIRAKDLIRLLFLATPKQLGLDKLRNLFDTCYAPSDVKNWIDNLEGEVVENPPYYEIIDLIYKLQTTDNEPPKISVIRYQLNLLLRKTFSTQEVTSFVQILSALVPGSISIEGENVGVQNKPDTIKSRIAHLINTDIPAEAKALYNDIFK